MAEAAKRFEERFEERFVERSESEADRTAGERRGNALTRAALFLIRREDVVLRPTASRPVWVALRDLRW
jgi:hypothetical protein